MIENLGWRGHAIALAALGASSVSRRAFVPVDADDPEPLDMEVLAALALQESMIADRPHRSSTRWLSYALAIDGKRAQAAVDELTERGLVRSESGREDEIEYELAEDHDRDSAAAEVPLVLTGKGIAVVNRWLVRVARQLRGWPPDVPNVDDGDSGP